MTKTNMYEITLSGADYGLVRDLKANDIPFQTHYDQRRQESYFYDIPVNFKTLVFFKSRLIPVTVY
jgi:hypothetical protein